MQGKPRELQADDDAKAAALMWASEAALGNTEVAAPKILGDIVESLVGAVYIDSHCNFDKIWEVRPTIMSVCVSISMPVCLSVFLPVCLSLALFPCLSDVPVLLSVCLMHCPSAVCLMRCPSVHHSD